MKNPFRLSCLARPAVVFALAVFLITPGFAGTQTGPIFVVNTLADTDDGSADFAGQGTGNQDCTLREALTAASAYGNGAIITFGVSGTIPLGSDLPAINRSITIDGSGQSVVLDGNGRPAPAPRRASPSGFDTYDTGGNGNIGIHVWVNGAHVAVNATNPYTDGNKVPVNISYDAATGLTVRFNDEPIFTDLAVPGFSLPVNGRFGVGARTGGANQRTVVDNVEIVPR